MKVLIVSWFFPPTNTMGAMRVGKFAEFLISNGHELRVISPREPPFAQTLDIDFPAGCVRQTPWIDVTKPQHAAAGFIKRLMGGAKRQASGGPATTPNEGGGRRGLVQRLSDLYLEVVAFPDNRIGWLPYAIAAGRRAMRDWKPDIILASGPPFTTLVAGYRLSKRARVPWIIEFRDRWTDDAYTPLGGWLLARGARIERRMIESAAALVTVSVPWAVDYRAKFPVPALVVYNGYDPRDYGDGPCLGSTDSDQLRIVYTGVIYPGKRDPSPLFEALSLMGEDAGAVSVEFYGTNPEEVYPLAEAFGVGHLVKVHAPITNRDCVKVQQTADILLLLQWNHPNEQGNVPGKLFEYLGARRPILGLGLESGVPATIIKERGAGYYLNQPREIVAQLKRWLDEKKNGGGIAALPLSCREGFARQDQYRVLEDLMLKTVADKAGQR